MSNIFIPLAALLGFSATAIGAFAAHGLQGKVPDSALTIIDTAVRYQFWHALVLFGLGILLQQVVEAKLFVTAGAFFAAGTLLFSGSLYVLALTELRHIGPLPIGLLTPLGGGSLLIGWLLLGIAGWKLA